MPHIYHFQYSCHKPQQQKQNTSDKTLSSHIPRQQEVEKVWSNFLEFDSIRRTYKWQEQQRCTCTPVTKQTRIWIPHIYKDRTCRHLKLKETLQNFPVTSKPWTDYTISTPIHPPYLTVNSILHEQLLGGKNVNVFINGCEEYIRLWPYRPGPQLVVSEISCSCQGT